MLPYGITPGLNHAELIESQKSEQIRKLMALYNSASDEEKSTMMESVLDSTNHTLVAAIANHMLD